MRVEIFHSLPPQAREIRQNVFIIEQGFQKEFDELDERAAHFVLFDDLGAPLAVCRVFQEGDGYILGRLAVVKEQRGKKLGGLLVRSAEEYVRRSGGTELRLHAQCRISAFYQKLGFSPFGDEDDDEGCLHIWMKKKL